MFCFNCGKPVDDGSRFCPYCGTKLMAAQPTPPEEEPKPVPEEAPVEEVPAEEVPVAEEAPVTEEPPASEPAAEPRAVPAFDRNTDDLDTASLKGMGGAPAGGGPYGAPQTPPPTRYSDPWSPTPSGQSYPADDSWAAPGVPRQGKKKHTGRTIGIIVGAVALVVVAAVVVLYFIGSGAVKGQEAVIDSYLSYAEDGNTQRIKALFYPAVVEDYEDLYGASNVVDVLDSWTIYYGEDVKDYEITSMDPQDSYLDTFNSLYDADADLYEDVAVKVTYESGETALMDFDMVQVDGNWYLADIW